MKLIFKIFLLHILITTCLNAQSVTWQKYYPYSQPTGISDIIQTFICLGGILDLSILITDILSDRLLIYKG